MVEVGEQQAAPLLDPDGVESVVSGVEPVDSCVDELWGGHQRSVAVVSPSVVGTAERPADGAVGIEKLGAPVPTGVGEASEFAPGVRGDENRAPAEVADEDLSDRVEFVGDADTDPGGAEDAVSFEGEEGLGSVGIRREGMGFEDGTARADPGILRGPVRGRGGRQAGSGHGAQCRQSFTPCKGSFLRLGIL